MDCFELREFPLEGRDKRLNLVRVITVLSDLSYDERRTQIVLARCKFQARLLSAKISRKVVQDSGMPVLIAV